MSFESIENSKERGEPYEKYVFQFGPNDEDVYEYINGVEDVETFKAVGISREKYKTSGKIERDQLNIRLPADTDLAKMILPYPPPYEISVSIFAGHYGDNEDMLVWIGRVLSNSFVEDEIALTCESTLISLKRRANRRRWQINCPLLLYSQGVGQCNVDRDAFTVTAVVAAVNNGVPLFEEGWNGPFDKARFKGGTMRWTSQYGVEYRMIRTVTDTRIEFNGLLRGLAEGDEVELTLGCRHTMTACREFDNILNYGGDPWIPTSNPVKHPNFW